MSDHKDLSFAQKITQDDIDRDIYRIYEETESVASILSCDPVDIVALHLEALAKEYYKRDLELKHLWITIDENSCKDILKLFTEGTSFGVLDPYLEAFINGVFLPDYILHTQRCYTQDVPTEEDIRN